MAPGEEFDSGMESQDNSASKEITPEKKAEIESNYEDEVRLFIAILIGGNIS